MRWLWLALVIVGGGMFDYGAAHHEVGPLMTGIGVAVAAVSLLWGATEDPPWLMANDEYPTGEWGAVVMPDGTTFVVGYDSGPMAVVVSGDGGETWSEPVVL